MNCPEDLYLDLLKRTLTASDYDESYWRVIEGSGKEIRVRHPIRSLKAFARQMILIARAVFGGSLMLVDRRRPDPAAREEGMDWPCFGYSMAGHKAIDNVRFCVEDVIRNGVPGDFSAWSRKSSAPPLVLSQRMITLLRAITCCR